MQKLVTSEMNLAGYDTILLNQRHPGKHRKKDSCVTILPIVKSELVGGIEQSCDILGGNVGLNVMDAVENETSPTFECLDIPPDMFPHFGGRAPWEDILGIDPAPPKYQALAELPFQRSRVHAFCADLDRIQDIDPVVQEVGDQIETGAAGMIPDLGRGQRLDVGNEPFLAGFDMPAVKVG